MLVPVARILFSLRTVPRQVVSERALRPALVVFIAVRILPENYLVADLPTKERLGLLAPPNTAQAADDARRAWLDFRHHTTPAVDLRDSRVLQYELS